ncbi:MAG TPA: hypothetical protein VFA92_03155, partial [Candidatus Binatia bacterium]|nr:hypothetical protein [Candidatus Binatia bacterium]
PGSPPPPPAGPWSDPTAPGTFAAGPGAPPSAPAWPEAPAPGPAPSGAQPWTPTATAPGPPSAPAPDRSWPVSDGDPSLRTKVAPIVPRQRPAALLPVGPIADAVPPRPKSSRVGLIAGLVAVGVGLALTVYAAVAVLPGILSPTPDKLQVTSLQVKALNTQGHCPSTTFKFDGTITTNGAGGTVQYQWTRPDGTQTTPTSVQLQPGSTSSHVSLDFPYTQKQSAQGQARLRVLSPGNQTSAPANVVYSCP